MSIISWIVLGLLAGLIAKILLPGRDPGGVIGTTLIGIAGAFVGGWLSSQFLDRPISNDFYDTATWIAAIAGSLVPVSYTLRPVPLTQGLPSDCRLPSGDHRPYASRDAIPVSRSVRFSRPARSPAAGSAVPGYTFGTPWNANRDGPPNTNRSPDANSTSVYGRPRPSVLPKRNTHRAPMLNDTTGAPDRSSLSWCMPIRAASS